MVFFSAAASISASTTSKPTGQEAFTVDRSTTAFLSFDFELRELPAESAGLVRLETGVSRLVSDAATRNALTRVRDGGVFRAMRSATEVFGFRAFLFDTRLMRPRYF